MKSRIHMHIFGDVQGVFFRANAQNEARRLGVVGWVRNVLDGSVEVLAEGERNDLEKLLEWCSHGPADASVSKIDYEWLDNKDEFNEFRVKYE